MLREEDSNRPSPRIEVEENTTLIFNSFYRSGIKFLSSKRIDLEKTLGLDLKSETKELIGDGRLPRKYLLFPSHNIRSTSIIQEVD